jgi:uncharacterized protein YjbJ (UPF0337 family)
LVACYVSFKHRWAFEWHHSTHLSRSVVRFGGTGSAKEIKGAVKQAAGNVVGDAKLEADGKAEKIKGKVQNAIGGLKDTLRGK